MLPHPSHVLLNWVSFLLSLFGYSDEYPVAPINNVPDEILERLFFIVCDEIHPNCTSRFPRLRKKSGVNTIAGVCSRWRTIALRTLAFMVLELPIEASMESIEACRLLIASSRAADMDIHIDFTRHANNGRQDADLLSLVMAVIMPHSHRWRSLKIVIRASSFICPILLRFQYVTSAPRLRVFEFLADGGSRFIPGFPLPGVLNNPRPLPLTHLSVSGGRMLHAPAQPFSLPYLIDLEILDRAEDRELTIPWHEVAFLLCACPSLKALKLDCNIDYDCLRAGHRDSRAAITTSTSSAAAAAAHCPCNGRVPKGVKLGSLVDLRVNRYDIEEITALVLQLYLPSIESLTLSRVEVYPTLQPRSGPPSRTQSQKRDRSRLPSVVPNAVFSRVTTLTLIDLEFDHAKPVKRTEFTASFFNAFPNLISLKLLECPEREFLAALVPWAARYVNNAPQAIARCPGLQSVRIEGGSTSPIVDFILARQHTHPIHALFLMNTTVDQNPRDLITLNANVESFKFGDTYRREGGVGIPAPIPVGIEHVGDEDEEMFDDEGVLGHNMHFIHG